MAIRYRKYGYLWMSVAKESKKSLMSGGAVTSEDGYSFNMPYSSGLRVDTINCGYLLQPFNLHANGQRFDVISISPKSFVFAFCCRKNETC